MKSFSSATTARAIFLIAGALLLPQEARSLDCDAVQEQVSASSRAINEIVEKIRDMECSPESIQLIDSVLQKNEQDQSAVSQSAASCDFSAEEFLRSGDSFRSEWQALRSDCAEKLAALKQAPSAVDEVRRNDEIPRAHVLDACLSISEPKDLGGLLSSCPGGEHEWTTQVGNSRKQGCPKSVYFSYVDPGTGKVGNGYSTIVSIQTCGGPASDIHATGVAEK